MFYLTLNNFTFNCRNYLQIKGCAMGKNVRAPSCANIFNGILEERSIYPLIQNNVKLYLRYIDDILPRFQVEVKSAHSLIKFDFSYSGKKVSLLDTLIYKPEACIIGTTLLHSFFPPPLLKGMRFPWAIWGIN